MEELASCLGEAQAQCFRLFAAVSAAHTRVEALEDRAAALRAQQAVQRGTGGTAPRGEPSTVASNAPATNPRGVVQVEAMTGASQGAPISTSEALDTHADCAAVIDGGAVGPACTAGPSAGATGQAGPESSCVLGGVQTSLEVAASLEAKLDQARKRVAELCGFVQQLFESLG